MISAGRKASHYSQIYDKSYRTNVFRKSIVSMFCQCPGRSRMMFRHLSIVFETFRNNNTHCRMPKIYLSFYTKQINILKKKSHEKVSLNLICAHLCIHCTCVFRYTVDWNLFTNIKLCCAFENIKGTLLAFDALLV